MLKRIASIDILRALTMFGMIFVNDFWTLTGVPKWLGHAAATEDYLGFSDVIFPLFLFIMGLSIPYAFANRKKKGDSTNQIVWHVLIRSASLLLMGFYMINLEMIHGESVGIGRLWWGIIMAGAMILIWNDWKKTGLSRNLDTVLNIVGFALLIFLGVIYHGGADGQNWMQTYWWGILGLIGWAYLVNALIYIFSKGNVIAIVFAWLAFNFLTVATHAGWMPELGSVGKILSPVLGGAIPAFTAAGMMASVLMIKLNEKDKLGKIYLILIAAALVSLLYGFGMRPLWGISKIGATPAWVGICSAIGFATFAVFYWLADEKGVKNWAKIIKPAGTATLTCYLLPYLIYPIRELGGLYLPEVLRTGVVGLGKSLIFSLLVIALAGLMERYRVKLKL